MSSIIEESLELRGIQPHEAAEEIVATARAKSRLSADQAMALAVAETRRIRDRGLAGIRAAVVSARDLVNMISPVRDRCRSEASATPEQLSVSKLASASLAPRLDQSCIQLAAADSR